MKLYQILRKDSTVFYNYSTVLKSAALLNLIDFGKGSSKLPIGFTVDNSLRNVVSQVRHHRNAKWIEIWKNSIGYCTKGAKNKGLWLANEDVRIYSDGKGKEYDVDTQDNIKEFLEDLMKDLQISVQNDQTGYWTNQGEKGSYEGQHWSRRIVPE